MTENGATYAMEAVLKASRWDTHDDPRSTYAAILIWGSPSEGIRPDIQAEFSQGVLAAIAVLKTRSAIVRAGRIGEL